VMSDPGKLRQILTNLIGNAIKFTEHGGVTVVTRVEQQAQDSLLILDVVDTGIGMTTEQADKVFEAFSQADTSITRRFGGTGLGLTISKRFAQGLGGDIVISSKPDEGSVFTTTINLGSLAGAEWLQVDELLQRESAEVESSSAEVSWIFPGARVLVVDDGDENRQLLQLVLEDHGLHVDTAVNGALALEIAADFDIILMDVQMPVMDGFTAVGLMREQGLEQPVIALTAEAMAGSEQRCLDAGYSRYLSKPIDIDQLMAMLAAELGAIRGRQTPELVEPERSAAAPVAAAPVRSSLPMEKPQFRKIAERFAVRLNDKLAGARSACNDANLEELAEFAHWLKGSAGSVGFHDFTEPARSLEQLTQQARLDEMPELLDLLEDLHKRIEIGGDQGAESTLATVAASTEKLTATTEGIESSLDGRDPRFQDIINRFTDKLRFQIEAMDVALEARDFEELANLAHWLKGSAGSIGFHSFTTPAAELETLARAEQAASALACMDTIRSMSERIVLPGNGSAAKEERCTIGPT
jgi:CheY-like chemotaxis protein